MSLIGLDVSDVQREKGYQGGLKLFRAAFVASVSSASTASDGNRSVQSAHTSLHARRIQPQNPQPRRGPVRCSPTVYSVVPDLGRCRYYSYGASVKPSLWSTFRQSHRIIEREEGPNDGLVSVTSSQWGGETGYKGTLMDVSHLDLINWTNRLRWLIWELTGHRRKFAVEPLPSGSDWAANDTTDSTPLHSTWTLQVSHPMGQFIKRFSNGMALRHVGERRALIDVWGPQPAILCQGSKLITCVANVQQTRQAFDSGSVLHSGIIILRRP